MVINLAVEYDPHRTIFIAKGLMAGGEVDDAEPAHTQSYFSLREDAVVVGPTVGHDVAHPPHDDGIDLRVSAELKYSRDPTHDFSFRPPQPRRNYGTRSRNAKSLR